MASMLTSNYLLLHKASLHAALCVLLLGKDIKDILQTFIQVSDSPTLPTHECVTLTAPLPSVQLLSLRASLGNHETNEIQSPNLLQMGHSPGEKETNKIIT